MLSTVDDIIEALGGTAATASLTGVTPPAVSNWRERRFIPAEHFVRITSALDGAGKSAPVSLFGFKPIAEAR